MNAINLRIPESNKNLLARFVFLLYFIPVGIIPISDIVHDVNGSLEFLDPAFEL